MTLDLEDVTGDEAYERWKWCEEAAKQLKERSPQEARIWWEKECLRPDWLECLPGPRDNILQFAERLEVEMDRWAEAASKLFDEERKEARRDLERPLNRKRRRLERVRQSQSLPEVERLNPGSALRFECGHVYLMEKLRWVRKEKKCVWESYPTRLFKIGATRRPWEKRRHELWREGLHSIAKYATVIPFELEDAIHEYYDHFRVRRQERQKGQRNNIRGERFHLALKEMDRFKDVVVKIEKWVLVKCEALLELEIMRMEATLSRMYP
jgi:hypothetical protein